MDEHQHLRVGYCSLLPCRVQELRRAFRCSIGPWHVRRFDHGRVHDCHVHVLYEDGADPEGWVLVYVLSRFVILTKADKSFLKLPVLMNGTGLYRLYISSLHRTDERLYYSSNYLWLHQFRISPHSYQELRPMAVADDHYRHSHFGHGHRLLVRMHCCTENLSVLMTTSQVPLPRLPYERLVPHPG